MKAYVGSIPTSGANFKTTTKMKKEQFIEERKLLLERKKEQENAVNVEYSRILEEFLSENSPVETHKVYELLKNGRKRRGFKRFVIYKQVVQMWDEDLMITVGGWWLNENNIPSKWDNMTVEGIGNPAIFELSESQDNELHPEI